jgi:hypothetical protein
VDQIPDLNAVVLWGGKTPTAAELPRSAKALNGNSAPVAVYSWEVAGLVRRRIGPCRSPRARACAAWRARTTALAVCVARRSL